MSQLELKIPPVIVVFIVVLIMGLTRSVFPYFGFPTVMANLFAGFTLISAVTFAVLGVREFRKHSTTVDPRTPEQASRVVNTGVFAVTRNPMYVAMLMFIMSLGFYWQHTGFIVFVVACLLYLQRFQIIPEERMLTEKFGDEYAYYCRKVARWF